MQHKKICCYDSTCVSTPLLKFEVFLTIIAYTLMAYSMLCRCDTVYIIADIDIHLAAHRASVFDMDRQCFWWAYAHDALT
jgi:hypothetical protein